MSTRISRREFLKRLLLATGSLAVGGCKPSSPTQSFPTSDPRTKPTVSQEVPSTDDLVQVTILHLSDFHGALYAKPEDGGERGGAADLVGLIDRKRAGASGPVLLLDAGDTFQGTFVSNSNRGEAVVEMMNLAGVKAMALGNHEFDWGLEVLRERSRQAAFPFLAANLVTESGQGIEGVSPYAILNADGVKVGVLGLTYHDLSTIVRASAIAGLRSLPPAETVRRYLPELEEQCDLIIVLSHLGLEGDEELARAVPGLSLIVGGHSHKALQGGRRIGGTLIVHAGAYGRYLGQLRIQWDRRREQVVQVDTSREVIKVTDAGTPNAQVADLVKKWGGKVEEVGLQVIGEAAIPLSKGRGVETALGNLITDAMRAADLGDGKAFDIAMHNDGGIRADLDAGPITYAEMYAVLPFDNNLVGLDLSGAQVKEMLENGTGNHGSEIQVSGLRFVYTLSKARGRRVMEVTINDGLLDPERTYRVATIDYLYSHPQYKDSLGLGENVMYGGLCLDAVVDYVRAHSPVQPVVEQRIAKM